MNSGKALERQSKRLQLRQLMLKQQLKFFVRVQLSVMFKFFLKQVARDNVKDNAISVK